MNTLEPRDPILVVEDDEGTRLLLAALLDAHGYDVLAVDSGEAALAQLERQAFDVALLDVNLPGIDGVEVLTAAQARAPAMRVIMVTAFASIDTAVTAMKRGACDYLRKPLRTEELLAAVERAVAGARARRGAAEDGAGAAGARARLVGRSAAMAQLWDRIEKVAPTPTTVLITGETGTGKELVAQAIHALSPRAREPFVASNCSSLAETLLESELFGHVKGSFTGAVTARRGVFEDAHRGTLFLDEVSTLTPAVQVKLLRVVQERVIQRVGSNTLIPVDLRLVAATNVELRDAVQRGSFREDLFYRLNVFALRVPPLRERREDIPVLVEHFLARTAARLGIRPPGLAAVTLAAMTAYEWPGNVRQLENYVESAVIAQSRGQLVFDPALLAATACGHDDAARPPTDGPPDGLAHLKRERVLEALAQSGGRRGRAAELLGVSRRTIYRMLKQYEADGATNAPEPGGAAAARQDTHGMA